MSSRTKKPQRRTLAPTVLHPERDPWEQQPGETEPQYAWFRHFLDSGRGRTMAGTADDLKKNPSYIRAVAAARLWLQRAAAHDRHRDGIRELVWREKCVEAADADAKILNAAAGKIAQRLMSMDPRQLSDGDFIRLFDAVMRHRRQLLGPAVAVDANVSITSDETKLDRDILSLLDQMDAVEGGHR
ncbi:hypothetical protein BJF83_20795 [Nocardiopsis sp. CNR-923]|uniref:hypothetical protein n=1 Tax=Nocardiopsis sp. CNR-923 TaxID=1904965 RepID=UPI00095EC015|nr:hypothetical protein [Nocardiopsis sp. CNR-923]OLT26526.1 hypothetical protein BJF83_20795 [Nocardiopsis sp. CNR-923]